VHGSAVVRLFLQTIAFAKVILIDGNDYHLLHLHASDFASAISEDEIIEILAEKVKDSQVPRCQRRTLNGEAVTAFVVVACLMYQMMTMKCRTVLTQLVAFFFCREAAPLFSDQLMNSSIHFALQQL